jgi:alkylation response protein AidB-like acyl-CoA dehydrogenase
VSESVTGDAIAPPDASRSLDDFRAEVRAWCDRNVPPGWQVAQAGASHQEFVRFQQAWFATLRTGGIAVPHWPAQWGGGFSLPAQAVIFEELARAEAPRLVMQFVSLHHAAATLLHEGTTEQKDQHLPGILAGEVWCQGFSEPGAGSDLASLQTKAVRKGDVFVVNGQKIWASLAMYADWCLLLARTDPTAPKRRGISYFIMDMTTPGLTVRPIQQATGETHFCEIFFTDVEIPVQNLIGDENDGWRVAQRTLGTERGATIVELSERLGVGFRWLCELAGQPVSPGASVSHSDDPLVRDRLARLASEVQALRLLTARSLDATVQTAGGTQVALPSMIKLYYSELLQRLTGFGVELSGLEGQREQHRPASSGFESGHWLLDFIGSWEWTIPGGTSEIQRSIIGERGLGLPREPAQS